MSDEYDLDACEACGATCDEPCWDTCPSRAAITRDVERRRRRDAVAAPVRIIWTVVPLAAAEQRGRDEVHEEWQQHAWERSERD